MSEASGEGQNEAVNTGPIEKSGGDSYTSFDELEQAESSREASRREEALQKAKDNLAVKKAEKDLGKEETEDSQDEVAEGEEGETLEDDTDTDDTKKKPKEEGKEKRDDVQVKKYKIKDVDGAKEITADSVHKVTINGKTLDVKYQDLINDYSGRAVITQRFQDLSERNKKFAAEKATFLSEKESFDTFVKEVTEQMKVDPVHAFAELAAQAGHDVDQYLKTLREKMVEHVHAYDGMSEDERAIHDRELATKRRERELEKREQFQKREKQKRELQERLGKIKKTYEIEDDQMRATFDELEGLQKKGIIKGQITPELIAEVIIDDRIHDRIKEVAQVVRPSLAEDKEAMADMVQSLRQFDQTGKLFSDDDIKDILIQAFPDQQVKALSRKVKKAEVKPTQKAVSPQNEPLTFDDLEAI